MNNYYEKTASGTVTNVILRTIFKDKSKERLIEEEFNPPLVKIKN